MILWLYYLIAKKRDEVINCVTSFIEDPNRGPQRVLETTLCIRDFDKLNLVWAFSFSLERIFANKPAISFKNVPLLKRGQKQLQKTFHTTFPNVQSKSRYREVSCINYFAWILSSVKKELWIKGVLLRKMVKNPLSKWRRM